MVEVAVGSLERLVAIPGREWGVSIEILGGPHGARHGLEQAWWLHGDPAGENVFLDAATTTFSRILGKDLGGTFGAILQNTGSHCS